MARAIVKTLTTTRVSFKTVDVENGVPCFVDQPDVVFSGVQDKEKVERLLKARLGKDAVTVITNINAGQHRYEVSMEEFVLNAVVVDNIEDGADEMEDDGEKPAELADDAGEQSPQLPADETADEPAAPEAEENGNSQSGPEDTLFDACGDDEGYYPF